MELQEIATTVRQHFQQKGIYLPTIFIELDSTDIEMLVLPQLKEKRYSMPKLTGMIFDAGRKFGENIARKQQDITGLCMAYSAVSQDAHNKGILVFKMSEVSELTCTTRFYDVHTGGSEITVDFRENPSFSGTGMVSPLLPAFMLGVVTVQKHQSADEGRRRVSALVSEYERIIRRARSFNERHQGNDDSR